MRIAIEDALGIRRTSRMKENGLLTVTPSTRRTFSSQTGLVLRSDDGLCEICIHNGSCSRSVLLMSHFRHKIDVLI